MVHVLEETQLRAESESTVVLLDELNHVTFINDYVGKVPPDQMPKLEQLARRAVYRFVLR